MNPQHELLQQEPTPIVPPDRLGPIGEALSELGLPFAHVLGSLLTLLLAFLVLYTGSRTVLIPLFDRLFTRRGVADETKPLLLRLINGIIVFVSIVVASVIAGYGVVPVLGISTVWAAAMLAIGFVFRQRLVELLVRGLKYSEPNR